MLVYEAKRSGRFPEEMVRKRHLISFGFSWQNGGHYRAVYIFRLKCPSSCFIVFRRHTEHLILITRYRIIIYIFYQT